MIRTVIPKWLDTRYIMGACEIKLTIEKKREKFHSNLDTLCGKVELTVTKEITVEDVRIKFEGYARTRIEQRQKTVDGKPNAKKTVRKEEHRFVYRVVTLFPPPNVRAVSDGKNFTLTPGKYEYDFEIKIPLMTECGDPNSHQFRYGRHSKSCLPPTSSFIDAFNVDYFLKVTVGRYVWYKPNVREIQHLYLRPFDPIDEIIENTLPLFLRTDVCLKDRIPKRIALTEKPTGPESYRTPKKKTFGRKLKSVFGMSEFGEDFAVEQDVPFALEVRVDSPFATINKPLNMRLFITSEIGPDYYKGIDGQSSGLGEFYLQNLKIDIMGLYHLIAECSSKLHEHPFLVCKMPKDLNLRMDLANLEPSHINIEARTPYKWEMELDYKLYGPSIIPDDLVPSFETCNIQVSYQLNIAATFTESIGSWSPKKIEITAPVVIVSGIPPPEEYIEMKQIPPHIAQQLLKEYPSDMGGMKLQEIFDKNTDGEPKPQRNTDTNVNGLPTYEAATQIK